MSSAPLYFENPEQAVERITELLRAESFAELARYFDLSSSPVERSALAEGRYLVRTEPPEIHHPGVPWRFVQPFAPGFVYAFHQPTDEPDVFRVMVEQRIPMGPGMPDQVGTREFRMRNSAAGWQLLVDDSLQ